MEKPISVKLVVSEIMTNRSSGSENNVIRFPKVAREAINSKRQYIELGVGDKEACLTLEIKQAYKEDVAKLKDMIENGGVSEEEAPKVGFVTKEVWNKVQASGGRKKESIWVSDSVANITIGADPEFGIYQDGEMVDAQDIEELSLVSKLGNDGVAIEIRPNGSHDHLQVINDAIQLLKKKGSKVIGKYDWKATAGGMCRNIFRSFGGHIHIGTPRIVKLPRYEGTFIAISEALNDLVALPLVNLDIHYGHERRNIGTRYGNPTTSDAVRTDLDGRWEWRVPSGVIMASPDLFEAVIGTTKACVEAMYTDMANAGDFNDKALKELSSDAGELFKKLQRIDKNTVNNLLIESPKGGLEKGMLKKCISRLKTLDNYDKYAESINKFEMFVRADPKKIDFSMKNAWLEDQPIIK
jgi:hypothetical protein